MGEKRAGEHKPDSWLPNTANAGMFIINKKVVEQINLGEDFSRDIWSRVPDKKAYYTTEYMRDIGTVTGYRQAYFDFKRGLFKKSTLAKKRPAFFLDRDGVINKNKGLINSWEKFEFLPGVLAALERINNSGYLAILVTNQSVVARGLCTIEELEEIHKKMQWKMAVYGCYFDKIYYCPHHPDSGFPEENKEYKIDCNCRKPKTGMFEQACNDFNIDLENSVMIGDTQIDADFAQNCGLPFLLNKNRHLYRFVSNIL
jgi:D,D-heptose 1,7-bisphosphate phosphatase